MLASGALGLISIPGEPRRLTREEIDARYPGLDRRARHAPRDRLRAGAIGGRILGRARAGRAAATWHAGAVTGDDPLAPFGPDAVDQVREVDGYRTVADLMVNSRYDPELDEVAAFEHQVGSHGALGGPQTHPFVLHPTDLAHRTDRSSVHPPCTACSRAGWPTSVTPSRLRA